MTRSLLTIMLYLALSATGISSGAMRFDGVDDYISTVYTNNATTGITVSLWAYRIGAVTLGGLTCVGADSANGFETFIASSTSNTYHFVKAAVVGIDSGITSPVNTWEHVTWTVESDKKPRLYINGILKFTSTDTQSIVASTHRTLIGALQNGSDNAIAGTYWNGSIDEVLIYNKSLTASEIQAMYASGGAWYPKDGLVSRWSMENNGVSTGQAHANGSTIKDSFGANNGTVGDGADGSMTLEPSPLRQKRGRR